MKQIDVDLDVHKAIEARRLSFGETENQILRRVFEIGMPATVSVRGVEPRERPSRRGGNYKSKLFGKEITSGSLKEVLKAAMLGIESQNPGFLEKLGGHRTVRGRRIVARKPEELYPGKPQLVENCAERLDSKWWFDTNVSFNQTRRYLRAIADIAGIKELTVEKR